MTNEQKAVKNLCDRIFRHGVKKAETNEGYLFRQSLVAVYKNAKERENNFVSGIIRNVISKSYASKKQAYQIALFIQSEKLEY